MRPAHIDIDPVEPIYVHKRFLVAVGPAGSRKTLLCQEKSNQPKLWKILNFINFIIVNRN